MAVKKPYIKNNPPNQNTLGYPLFIHLSMNSVLYIKSLNHEPKDFVVKYDNYNHYSGILLSHIELYISNDESDIFIKPSKPYYKIVKESYIFNNNLLYLDISYYITAFNGLSAIKGNDY